MDPLADITSFAKGINDRAKLWAIKMSGDGVIHTTGTRVNENGVEPFDDGSNEGIRNDDFPCSGILVRAELGKLVLSMLVETVTDLVSTLFCFFDNQYIGALFKYTTNPVRDLLVTTSPA